MDTWKDALRTATKVGPAGVRTVALAPVTEAARESGLSPAEVEIWCLEENIVPEKYERSMGTLGPGGQAKLLRSHFAVAGCGGLGGLVIDLLARSGVGTLSLADGDHFTESNLNRQILCDTETLGMPKVHVAAGHVSRVNPSVRVRAMEVYLDSRTLPSFLEGVEIAIDALDNNSSRRLLFAGCRERNIPVIHGAIGGFWGQVQAIRPGDRTLLDLDSEEDVPDRGIEVQTGNPPFTPALIASLQVSEALRLFLGLGDVPSGSIRWIDLKNGEFSTLPLGPQP